jgi:hypothetical protein
LKKIVTIEEGNPIEALLGFESLIWCSLPYAYKPTLVCDTSQKKAGIIGSVKLSHEPKQMRKAIEVFECLHKQTGG